MTTLAPIITWLDGTVSVAVRTDDGGGRALVFHNETARAARITLASGRFFSIPPNCPLQWALSLPADVDFTGCRASYPAER